MSKFIPAEINNDKITEEEQRKLLDEFSMDIQDSNVLDMLNVRKNIEQRELSYQFNNKKDNDRSKNPVRYENNLSERLEINFDKMKNEVSILLDNKVIKTQKLVLKQASEVLKEKENKMRTMTFTNQAILDTEDNEIINLLTFGDGFTSLTLSGNTIPQFINDANSDSTIVDRALTEILYVTFRNYIPQAIFKLEDFQTRIDSLISKYNTDKYFFYEEDDEYGSKYVLCYLLDDDSIENLRDTMDDMIGSNRILTWFGRLMQMAPPATIETSVQILRFINSPHNQQNEFVAAILSDADTEHRTDTNGPSILSLIGEEFSTLQAIYRIMEKIDGKREDAEEFDEVNLEDDDDGIVRFEKDSE